MCFNKLIDVRNQDRWVPTAIYTTLAQNHSSANRFGGGTDYYDSLLMQIINKYKVR